MIPQHMIGVHWIPTHRGPEDREFFARANPAFIKIVCADEKPPYLEDMPTGAKIVIRNHPLSELYGERGFRAVVASDGERVAQYTAYFSAWAERVQQAHEAEPENPLARPERGVPLGEPPDGSRAVGDPAAHARQHGIEAADSCARMADYCVSRGVARGRLLFEGLNEPMLWSDEPPELTAEYYLAFITRLHVHDLHGVVGNFGVGWPGNGGGIGAPVQWDFFRPVIASMRDGDYLGLHEYWALNGPQENWRWWAGRYEQCPFDVPILVTETGIDTGVTGNWFGGWWDLPGSMEEKAIRYVGELGWYAAKGKVDGRVKCIFPFTRDVGSAHWERFNTRNQSWERAFLEATVIEPPVDKPQPVDQVSAAFRAEFGPSFVDLRSSLPQHATLRYAGRSAPPTQIVVHHSASPKDTPWENVARYHVSKGWPGIGYHIGITPDGQVVYLGDVGTVRYHATSANALGVGVCCMGNYEDEEPMAQIPVTLRRVIGALERALGRSLQVIGHRDVPASGTVCPGKYLYARLNAPVPPALLDALFDAGARHQSIQLNPNAALQKAIFGAGFVPNSGEFDIDYGGSVYRAQRAEDLGTGKVRLYFCLVGQWDKVEFVER